jgi:hypothetical protein
MSITSWIASLPPPPLLSEPDQRPRVEDEGARGPGLELSAENGPTLSAENGPTSVFKIATLGKSGNQRLLGLSALLGLH